MSLVTFNDDVKTIYECVPVNEVKELTAETYRPDCCSALHCTALYYAMGMSLNALRKKVAEEDKVLVTVVTDGYENASKEYSGKAIKALVDELKAKGWGFAYIGANQDVKAMAATISITNVMNFETTSAGAQMMTDRVNRSRERLYNCMTEPDFSAVMNILHSLRKKQKKKPSVIETRLMMKYQVLESMHMRTNYILICLGPQLFR